MSGMFRNFHDLRELGWVAIKTAHPKIPDRRRSVPLPALRLKTILLNRERP